MRGHIRQRAKGSWSIVITLGRDKATGKLNQQWHTVRGTKKEAEAKLRELLDALEKGTYVKPSKMTLGEWMEMWLESYVKVNCTLRTYDGYHSVIKNHLAPNLGMIPLTQLKPQQIQQYYSKEFADGKGLSARTVLHIHRILYQALKYAMRQGILMHNAADLVDPPRAKKSRMRTLIPSEVAKLFEVAKDTPYYPIYYTAINTGLRQSELLGLRWRDVDLDLAALSVNQVLYKRRRVCIFKEPKSEHSRRRLDLSPSLSLYLRTYRAQKEAEYAALGKTLGDDDLVFSRIDGTAVDPGTLTHHFADMVRKLGFSRVRFHDLRHSFASLMLLAGVHPKVVSEMLGHSSVAFTLDTYSHVIGGLQKSAMLKLDEMLHSKLAQIENISKILADEGDLDTASGQSRTDDRRFTKPLLYH